MGPDQARRIYGVFNPTPIKSWLKCATVGQRVTIRTFTLRASGLVGRATADLIGWSFKFWAIATNEDLHSSRIGGLPTRYLDQTAATRSEGR